MRHKKIFILACIMGAGLLVADIMNRPVISQMGFTLPTQIQFLPSLPDEAVLARDPQTGTYPFPSPTHGGIARWNVYVNGLRQLQTVQYDVLPSTGPFAVRQIRFLRGVEPESIAVMEYWTQ
jgi:hypothetical protein